MEKTKQPVGFANDKAEFAVEAAQSDQKLQEAKDRTEAIEGIRRGLESMKQKQGQPAAEFFDEFFAEKRISERE